MGGGIAVAAIGGTEAVMSAIGDGRYEQVGTFNGNPLAMAAARATLSEVLTDDGYAHLDALAARLREAVSATITESGSAWHVVSIGAKGCITFRAEPVREYRDFLGIDDRSVRRTGSSSTTAACSCHRGGRWSSGCCPSSTTRRMSIASRATSRASPARRCAA